jgi:hypothetical protein
MARDSGQRGYRDQHQDSGEKTTIEHPIMEKLVKQSKGFNSLYS